MSANSRRPINPALRLRILERDRFTCRYCGAHPPQAVLRIDHIFPVARGGDNAPKNLITACVDCNSGKHMRVISAATFRTVSRSYPDGIEDRPELVDPEADDLWDVTPPPLESIPVPCAFKAMTPNREARLAAAVDWAHWKVVRREMASETLNHDLDDEMLYCAWQWSIKTGGDMWAAYYGAEDEEEAVG